MRLTKLVHGSDAQWAVAFLAERHAGLPENSRQSVVGRINVLKNGLADQGVLCLDLAYRQLHCRVQKCGDNAYSTSLFEAFCQLSQRQDMALVAYYPSETALLLAQRCGRLVYLVPRESEIKGLRARKVHHRLIEMAAALILDGDREEAFSPPLLKPTLQLHAPTTLQALASPPHARQQRGEGVAVVTGSDSEKVVDLLNVYFFDPYGDTVYAGGAERYILDLSRLLREKGFRPRILQSSLKPFEREVDGFQVLGLPASKKLNLQKLFEYYLKNFRETDRLICSPLTIARRHADRNIIGISHSVSWDHGKWSNRLRAEVCLAVDVCQMVVCNDTNFLNWMRTADCSLAQKLLFVPNYYDPKVFAAREKAFSDEEIVIAFPRRLQESRGIYHAIELVRRIAPRFGNTRFLLAGQAVNRNMAEQVEQLASCFPGRVSTIELSFDQVADVYHQSQIVLIPTVHTEGTSLSCIEALATNNAVVATNVGGLTNLIIDGHNGLLIPPTECDLERAVVALLLDREKRATLARNGLVSVQPFQKVRWEKQWAELIEAW